MIWFIIYSTFTAHQGCRWRNMQRHFHSSDILTHTTLDLHFNIVSPLLHFRFHRFIACLIRCIVLPDIFVYWRTTSALLLLLLFLLLSTLWWHRSHDVIGHMTIRLSINDFLYVLNGNQTRISLSFHNIISDIITPGSTIRVNPMEHSPLC